MSIFWGIEAMDNKVNIDMESLITLSSFEVTEEDKKVYEKEIGDFLEYAKIIKSDLLIDFAILFIQNVSKTL